MSKLAKYLENQQSSCKMLQKILNHCLSRAAGCMNYVRIPV